MKRRIEFNHHSSALDQTRLHYDISYLAHRIGGSGYMQSVWALSSAKHRAKARHIGRTGIATTSRFERCKVLGTRDAAIRRYSYSCKELRPRTNKRNRGFDDADKLRPYQC